MLDRLVGQHIPEVKVACVLLNRSHFRLHKHHRGAFEVRSCLSGLETTSNLLRRSLEISSVLLFKLLKRGAAFLLLFLL